MSGDRRSDRRYNIEGHQRRESDSSGRSRSDRRNRGKPDWVPKVVTAFVVLGWLCVIVSLILMRVASPGGAEGFQGLLGFQVAPTAQSVALLRFSLISIIFSVVTCSVGLVLNTTRKKRKSDRWNHLLIFLCVTTVLLAIYFFVHFGAQIT